MQRTSTAKAILKKNKARQLTSPVVLALQQTEGQKLESRNMRAC